MSEHIRSTNGGRRPYRLKERAAGQERTRRRITEAAVELHQERGPLGTTISAIAERAGVQRLTVYRHFPDEQSLLGACTQHFLSQNPPPEPDAWAAVQDPVTRLQRALGELYRYWDRTERMFASVLRDHEVDPERAGRGVMLYMARARDVLVTGWGIRGRRQRLLVAVISHAVHFHTWRSLVRHQGLRDEQAVELMVALARQAAGERTKAQGTPSPTAADPEEELGRDQVS